MQWKRGFLLAGIHLAVVVAMFVQEESAVWPMIKANTDRTSVLRLAAWQEDGTVPFNPCDGGIVDGPMPTEEKIVGFANLPIALLTGWHQPCTSPSRLTAMVEGNPARPTHGSEIAVSPILCVLVFIQWLLVGGFPVVKPKQWWLEPGAFITACTLMSVALMVVPGFHAVSYVPMLLAVLAWVYLIIMALWNGIQIGLRKGMAREDAS